MTVTGTTNNEICVEDPTATPIARSILFFIATETAVICNGYKYEKEIKTYCGFSK
ncbi:MAG: hypothetical protein ACI8RD_003065 [Bacillariaceae sp.]|jgi:hypothetical protein